MTNTKPLNLRCIVVITYNSDKAQSFQQDDAVINVIKQAINKDGYVWYPWKDKAEKLPDCIDGDDVDYAKDFDYYLLHKETKKLYKLEIDNALVSFDKEGISLKEKTEYSENALLPQYCGVKRKLWLKITDVTLITDASKFIKSYSFFNGVNPCSAPDYKTLFNKKVPGRGFLLDLWTSIFFLRPSISSDSNIERTQKLPQEKYATKFSCVSGNEILLMSDLHCESRSSCVQLGGSLAQKVVTCIKENKPAALIVSGDFSDKGSDEGFYDAEGLIATVCRANGLLEGGIAKESIVIVPGNHDISFGASNASESDADKTENKTVEELHYCDEVSKTSYKRFFKEILDCDPHKSLCRGVKIILDNGMPIEILGVNSVPYMQIKKEKYDEGESVIGFGLLDNQHLTHAAEQMKWKPNSDNYTYRILVFHHPMFPVGERTSFNQRYQQEVVINPKVVRSFIDDYDIDLVITGHAHEDGSLSFVKSNGKICSWLGLSSLRKDLKDSRIYRLDFAEFGRVKCWQAEGQDVFKWQNEPFYDAKVNACVYDDKKRKNV